MTDTLDISTPAELVAVVPHLLGFNPEDSLVCVPTNGGGPLARIDLPHDQQTLNDVTEALADAYRRNRDTCPAVAILAFSDQTGDAVVAIHALTDALAGTSVGASLLVDQDQWTDITTGETGEIDAASRDRIAAEMVGRGRALPKPSRHDLARALEGDDTAVDELMPAALTRSAELTHDDIVDEAGWVLNSLERFQQHPVPLSDPATARLVAALTLSPIRDLVLAEHSLDNAETMSSLWRDLTRRTPRPFVGPVAELLAFSSWLSGNGAEAWVALDVRDGIQATPLADFVAGALQAAAPPHLWETARQAIRSQSTTPVTQAPPTP